VIWVPKRGGTESDVPEATRFVSDSRSRHYWDEGGRLMQRYARRLGLPRDAWDVYLIYGQGTRWEDEPPRPAFWMHQLASGAPAPELDGEQFAKEAIARLMRRTSP